ncbi:MAG: sialate O-acetylesterase [Planctomycetota bacterium]
MRCLLSAFRPILFLFAAVCWSQFLTHPTAMAQTETENPKAVRVFLLAGQSNMQGHGVIDLDDEKDYNGGRGTLKRVFDESPERFRMAHLKDDDGEWKVRDDVFVWYQTERELKTGPLTIGYSGYSGKHHFGPELQIGHVLGDAFEEPVLLIKTAWGGKSLHVDFRPSIDGSEPGEFYIKMLEQLGQAMTEATQTIPALKDCQLKLEGVIWQQGWNDMVDQEATEAYAKNLEVFVAQLRKQFAAPELPFVYGELGNSGDQAGESLKKFRLQQVAFANKKTNNVRYVPTAAFARDANDSPNRGHGHHWYGNAESYFLVGDALGRAMVDLTVPTTKRKRVLILGDSISMGYTPFVKELLGPAVEVYRPKENCQGTDHGIKNIDRWLKQDGGNWDVIHFNFGLHDLKHVKADTGKNSNSFDDPLQSGPDDYRSQMKSIVEKLVATDAKLILCTTTPVPEGVKPARDPASPQLYNTLAKEVCVEVGGSKKIVVNDLYQFANDRLETIQRPKNVHFSKDGSKLMAAEVAKKIRAALGE